MFPIFESVFTFKVRAISSQLTQDLLLALLKKRVSWQSWEAWLVHAAYLRLPTFGLLPPWLLENHWWLQQNLWWIACWKPCTKLDWMISLTSLTSCALPSYLHICHTWSRGEMSLTATWGNRGRDKHFNSFQMSSHQATDWVSRRFAVCQWRLGGL